MASNQLPCEWQSLMKNLDNDQQVAIESLKENGCSTKETKTAISIFKRSNGHGDFFAMDLMKIILNQRDKENDGSSADQNESSSEDETSNDDKENSGHYLFNEGRSSTNIEIKKCVVCYKSTMLTSRTVICDGCKGSVIPKRKRHLSANF